LPWGRKAQEVLMAAVQCGRGQGKVQQMRSRVRTEDRNCGCGTDRGGKVSTEKFVTAKNIRQLVKQESRITDQSLVEHTRYCTASAVRNCKNIRLCIETVEENTLSAMTGHFTTAKTSGCANV